MIGHFFQVTICPAGVGSWSGTSTERDLRHRHYHGSRELGGQSNPVRYDQWEISRWLPKCSASHQKNCRSREHIYECQTEEKHFECRQFHHAQPRWSPLVSVHASLLNFGSMSRTRILSLGLSTTLRCPMVTETCSLADHFGQSNLVWTVLDTPSLVICSFFRERVLVQWMTSNCSICLSQSSNFLLSVQYTKTFSHTPIR